MAFNFLTISDSTANCPLPFAFADQMLYSSTYGVKLVYLSAYAYSKSINMLKPITRNTRREGNISYVRISNYRGANLRCDFDYVDKDRYESKISRLPGDDVFRIVSYPKRESVEHSGNGFESQYHLAYFPLSTILEYIQKDGAWEEERLITELFSPTAQLRNTLIDCDAIVDEIYKVIRANVAIPFLKEWVNYVMTNCPHGLSLELPKALYADVYAKDNVYALVVRIHEKEIQQAVTNGLKSGCISINGCNEVSEVSRHTDSLTEYLQHFSSQLIDKAATKFKARFTPGVDSFTEKEANYFDYAEYFGKLKLYEPQKNVIAAVSRSLDHNRSSFIVGECGVGKTALGIGSIYCHAKSSHVNSIILCPGHLVRKWSREILRLYPDARTRIIADFQDLLDVEAELTCALRRYPLFLIISKDTAKINYAERPSVIWDARNHQFLCPNCGSPIEVKRVSGRYSNAFGLRHNAKKAISYPIETAMTLFLEQNSRNSKCNTMFMTSHYNHVGKKSADRYSCGSKLWACTNTKEESKWIRHASIGWLNTDMIPEFMAWYTRLPEDSPLRSHKSYKKIYNAIVDIQENGVPRLAAPRRSSLSRYIREKLNGKIDYLIADECHLYNSGESAQANAFGDLVRVADKTLALTGTLINGYSSNLFYPLMRLYSREFIKRGFNYNSVTSFVEKYGVYRDTITEKNQGGRLITTKATRVCPGVSAKLYTDMLLDKTAFLSLSDMSAALPSFTETCVPIDMDSATSSGYNAALSQLRNLIGNSDGDDVHQLAFTAAQKLYLYPDQPYDMAPIYSHKTGDVLISFPNAVHDHENFLSNKDLKVLEITRERISRGEKVLIYTSYVNKVDSVDRMLRMFEVAGIKACHLTASVKPSEREEWIEKHYEENDVMITNSSLVETGLDILMATSIIYVSMSWNLFTLRQSSRRSLRLNQTHPVHVYYLYYRNTTQQTLISVVSEKLRCAMTIEGKFSEEGLQSMNNNDSMLTQIATSLMDNIERKIDEGSFSSGVGEAEKEYDSTRFTLAQMLEDEKDEVSYRLLPKVKRPVALDLCSICA